MSDKYIIRNCPSIYENYEDKFVCTSQIKEKGFPFYCQDRTDCVLKQIVELCEEESSIMQHKQKVKVKGLNKLADKIFELLDIQEVE